MKAREEERKVRRDVDQSHTVEIPNDRTERFPSGKHMGLSVQKAA